jgi:hypothetical protein
MRYRLLTYLYSTMHLVHSHGGTLARPLFFTDPTDKAARCGVWVGKRALPVKGVLCCVSSLAHTHYALCCCARCVLRRRVQGQWMLGEALLISPVLERDSTQVEAHFTTGTW